MATLNALSNQEVANGATAEIDLSFTLNAGQTATVTVTLDGGQQGSAVITFDGEALPVVNVGSTGQGWEIQSSSGTLTALGSNKFSLTES